MKTTLLNLSKLTLLLFLGMGIVLVSCSGEDGKDGLNGEMGIQGEQGAQGVQGPQGEQGQDGNANVIVSDWMQIAWDNVDNNVPPTFGQMFIEEIPGIADIEAFLETGGVILVYLKRDYGLGTFTLLLPYQDGSDHIYTYTATATDPNILPPGLVIVGEANDVSNFENNDAYLIKYVIVPANVAQASDLVNKMPENFGEAATLLGLDQ
ncbi:collagen-like protein [Flagellimonas taeanensis]|uniref:collagen-like protein n=1 Tax=Flagellimonas taeanensis TaxID=1005926 RepID=UPI000E6A21DC|nr:collagen-like protein [Allomuricauda taeanensis]RIV49647.1 collagen-like protein [Allomuricauda taeanensis]RIV53846.1 collagen-like protein [Allomuricauda taeanensis]